MSFFRAKVFKISLILLVSGSVSISVFSSLRVPSSHILAVLQFIVIIAFSTILIGLSDKLTIHFSTLHGISCIVFAGTSMLLLVWVVLKWYSIVTAGLSLFVSSFLPGYCMLRLLRINHHRTGIEIVVMSYALSMPITAIVGTMIFLCIGGELREIAFAITYFLMSLILLLFTSKLNGFETHRSEIIIEITQALLLLVIGTFFLVFIDSFYPSMAYNVPGFDLVQHFGTVKQIVRAPELFSSPYPWFNFYEAVFFVLGKPSLEIFQTSLALSSFIMILTFYSMASIYLKKIDPRLPVIATAFWSIFGGFGWLWFLRKTLQTNASFFDLLGLTNDISYLDISIPRVWFWFRPMVPGFTLLFVLLYLLKRQEISTIHFRFMFCILIMSLALFHIPELVILVVVFFVLSFFAPHVSLRLKDATIASVAGLSVAIPIFFSLYRITGTMASILLNTLLLGLILALILSYLLLKSGWKGMNISRKSAVFVVYATIVAYLAGTIAWIANPSFSISMVRVTLFVPWLLYPVRLGIVGLLGLMGLLTMRRSDNGVVLFAFMFFSSLLFARLLSYVNIYLFPTGFWEQRLIQASLLPSASVLAALSMKPLMTRIPSFRHVTMRRVFMITLISSLIVIVGTTSILLSYDFLIETSRRNTIGDEELSSVNFLSNALYDNPRSPVLTLTIRSMTEVDFAGPISIVNPLHLPAWSSTTPEVPLIVLLRGYPEFTAPYIYLHERDKDAITRRFPTGVLLEDITPLLPPIYQNERVELYKVPEGTPPIINSSTILLVPFNYQEKAKAILPVFMSLSLGAYEYTTMLDSDISALTRDVIIIPIDTMSAVVDQLLKGSKNGLDKRLVVFNSMGYGSICKDLFFEEFSGEKAKVNLIEGVEKLSLPFDVYLTPIKAKADVEILGWFSGEKQKIPFAAKKVIGGIQVIYLNVYPMISHMNESPHHKTEILTLLAAMLNTVELGLKRFSTTDFKLQDLLLFKEATSEGIVTIEAGSIIFPSTRKIKFRLEGEHEVHDAYSISLTGFDNVTVRTNYMRIGQGKGFYARLVVGNSTFELNGGEIGMNAKLENGEVRRLIGLSKLKFYTEGSTTIYTRTPTLSINGNTTFKEAYGLHEIYTQFRTSGQTLRSSGSLSCTILASDTYTIGGNLSWRGSVQLDPAILQWDELGSLKDSAIWFPIAVVIFVLGYLVFTRTHLPGSFREQ